MARVLSSCCEFEVGNIENANAYCYVCGRTHDHGHLDLRGLRTVLLGKVVRRHNLNWEEIAQDTKKYDGMRRGVFCQSILTEIEALCPHGNPITYNEKPLRLHMCYGSDDGNNRGGENPATVDLSVEQGLDFTSDLCFAGDSLGAGSTPEQAGMAADAEASADRFKPGDVLKYCPEQVAFRLA